MNDNDSPTVVARYQHQRSPRRQVTEGTDATFMVTASTAPASALTVTVTVTQTGMFIMGTAPPTVEIPAGMTTATLPVPTENDNTAEMNGSIQVTVTGGYGLHRGNARPRYGDGGRQRHGGR